MRVPSAIALLLCLTAPLVALAAQSRPAPAAKPDPAFAKTVQPFLAAHCLSCHQGKGAAAGLDMQALRPLASLSRERHAWEHVAQKLKSGEMPPKGSPRPPQAQVAAVTRWIEGWYDRADRTGPIDPGRVTARRLNRAEYNNTVRDLLGIDLRPADDFPQDDSGYGFDNIGDVLSLSPVLMERYLAAAEKVTRTAIFGPEAMKPTLAQLRRPGRPIQPATKIPAEYDRTGLTLPNATHATYRFPVEGEYAIKVVLGGERPAASEPMQLALWIDGRKLQERAYDPQGVASFEIDRQDLAGQSTEFRQRVTGGEHWVAVSIQRLYEGLPPSYGGPNPSKRPPPPPPDPNRFARFLEPPPNATPEQIEEFRRRRERFLERVRMRQQEKSPVNAARVNYVEVAGPYQQAKGPSEPSLRKVFTCGHLHGGHQPGCERKILADFARRAFRRPVTPPEIAPYLRLVADARKQGDSLEEGICVALQAVLVSPHFLFRIERDPAAPAARAYPIGQHELASRLSYFLWSSAPDDELLRTADRGLLRKPEVLAAQVRRMLQDPKSSALVENFAGQWLELRKLESVKPDRERFTEFDEYLRLSIRRETELFFEHLLREDRSLVEFLDADYSFLNERLARYYGIPGVEGPEFRRVDLKGTHRGGLLTQASILTVSSYSTRTSPVLRGKWILENILNAPPPPPPPNVPVLDETKIGQSASLRQQLEVHRQNPTCASCHNRLDPLGFALENFDAIGGWRTQDGKVPIDPSGSLPDGRTFQGPDDLKRILTADRDAFARCLTEKLLTYALGRGLEASDRSVVKRIASRTAEQKYKFSTLVQEIVTSVPFQMRRGDRRT
jgi:mono/diheme cytochrome c family protein